MSWAIYVCVCGWIYLAWYTQECHRRRFDSFMSDFYVNDCELSTSFSFSPHKDAARIYQDGRKGGEDLGFHRLSLYVGAAGGWRPAANGIRHREQRGVKPSGAPATNSECERETCELSVRHPNIMQWRVCNLSGRPGKKQAMGPKNVCLSEKSVVD